MSINFTKKILFKGIAFLLLIICAFTFDADAQQDPRYTMYMFNKQVVNPGYTGSTSGPSFTGILRTQWRGIDGAPNTVSLSGHMPFKEKAGFGAYLQYDEIGLEQTGSAFVSYAYKIPLSIGTLQAGLSGGAEYYNVRLTEANMPGLLDPAFQENETRILPNFGAGLYFHTDAFFVGASVPYILNNDLTNRTEEDVSKQFRHIWVMAGAIVPINDIVKVRPSILFKTIPTDAPSQFDFNLSFLFVESIWLGASYRTDKSFAPESLDFILSYQFRNGLRLGYAYDLTLNDLNQYTNGSHEVMFGWDIFGTIEKIITPRYF